MLMELNELKNIIDLIECNMLKLIEENHRRKSSKATPYNCDFIGNSDKFLHDSYEQLSP